MQGGQAFEALVHGLLIDVFDVDEAAGDGGSRDGAILLLPRHLVLGPDGGVAAVHLGGAGALEVHSDQAHGVRHGCDSLLQRHARRHQGVSPGVRPSLSEPLFVAGEAAGDRGRRGREKGEGERKEEQLHREGGRRGMGLSGGG